MNSLGQKLDAISNFAIFVIISLLGILKGIVLTKLYMNLY